MKMKAKTETVQIFHLLLIMAAVGLIMSGVSIAILYETSFQQTRQRLIEVARSRARIMEAMARYDIENHFQGHDDRAIQSAKEITLGHVRAAHDNFIGFGRTGEFTLAELKGDDIVFLLRHRHIQQEPPPSHSHEIQTRRTDAASVIGTLRYHHRPGLPQCHDPGGA